MSAVVIVHYDKSLLNLFRFGVEIVSVSRSSTVQAQPPIVSRARLVSRVSFDREEIKTYQLRIMAMDLSDRPLNASIPVTVTVADKNDNQPTFSTDSQTFNIPENTQATLITELAVSVTNKLSVILVLSTDALSLFVLRK